MEMTKVVGKVKSTYLRPTNAAPQFVLCVKKPFKRKEIKETFVNTFLDFGLDINANKPNP